LLVLSEELELSLLVILLASFTVEHLEEPSFVDLHEVLRSAL
jgi:hypothetical protein